MKPFQKRALKCEDRPRKTRSDKGISLKIKEDIANGKQKN